MKYLLDANVFIEANKRYYSLEVCPAFWDWILLQAEKKIVVSIEKVYEELKKKEDALSKWAKEHKEIVFKEFDWPPSSATRVTDEIQSLEMGDAKTNEFLNGADYYLVVYAASIVDCTVVTEEKLSSEKRRPEKKIQIPDVCKSLNIEWTSTFKMLKNLKARFILAQNS